LCTSAAGRGEVTEHQRYHLEGPVREINMV
jgi:hypothetical protein